MYTRALSTEGRISSPVVTELRLPRKQRKLLFLEHQATPDITQGHIPIIVHYSEPFSVNFIILLPNLIIFKGPEIVTYYRVFFRVFVLPRRQTGRGVVI